MKRLFLAACGLLFLGACAALNQSNDADSATAGGTYNADGVFVAYCSGEPAPVIFTKEGFPIIDDQACIPEPEVLGIQVRPKEKTCRPGKRLVGRVCLAHNPTPRTPSTPACDEDLNPWAEGLQCEAPAACEEGELRNGQTGVCEPFVCDTGFSAVGNACFPIQCATGEVLNGNSCDPIQCATGEVLNGNSCDPIQCATGEVLNGNSCDPIQCANNEVLNGNICVPKNQCNSGGGNESEPIWDPILGVWVDCDPGNSDGGQAGD